jgi:hypothetical protein
MKLYWTAFTSVILNNAILVENTESTVATA